jgi:hypothetical protein
VLVDLPVVPTIFARRCADGMVELCGLGHPCYGTDDEMVDALIALPDLGHSLDSDDLRMAVHDAVASTVADYRCL